MESEITQLDEQILYYMELHPHAADTAEGIATWWLKHDNRVKLSRVKGALENLVERGMAVRRKSQDGHILYSKGNVQLDHFIKHRCH